MNTIFHIYIIGIILLVIGGIIYLFLRHQRNLKSRAFLMQEAIRNGDYSFRLSTKGLLFGERALQQALNDMENDIGRLVAQHEVESWQRLTRVLTHEIMNATAPISSICQAYLSNPQIEWHIHIPEDATWSADKNMLRQVFINLTKNAIEAHASAIDIRCFHKHPESIESSQFSGIYFSNNGDPIPADVAKEMFIPFFSTKPSGSGIGLSISRQMLMMQSINLSLAEHNVAGYHVTFRME